MASKAVDRKRARSKGDSDYRSSLTSWSSARALEWLQQNIAGAAPPFARRAPGERPPGSLHRAAAFRGVAREVNEIQDWSANEQADLVEF